MMLMMTEREKAQLEQEAGRGFGRRQRYIVYGTGVFNVRKYKPEDGGHVLLRVVHTRRHGLALDRWHELAGPGSDVRSAAEAGLREVKA